MIGRTILHYKILGKLGEGGMGVVFKAEDIRLKRNVAIKFLPNYISANEEERIRFETEAQAAATLSHPNITTIYSIEESENYSFIVMELIDGIELKDKIKSGQITITEANNLCIQIAEGLKEAHKKGIVHRDIKTQNIMVTKDSKIKIMDFGLAKIAQGAQITKMGTTLGTIAYMSPEQARGEELDHRTDIWSFGVVIYEMLTGTLPFASAYDQAIIYSILHEQPKPLTEFRSDLPKAFEHLTQKCLSKNRDDRYNSVNEILQQLLELNSGTSGGSANFENNTSKNIDQSVAVLEFNNITGDSLVDWLGEGISETVTVDLKKISAIKVISREKVLEILKNASDKKLTEEKIIDIGKKLKTRWIVWGGFQKSGKAIRITAHFTEIMSGEILGSAKVDGNIEDIFKLQDSIITALAETLKLVLSPTEKKKIAKPETLELEAYEYYIKGRQLFNHFGKASFDEAQSFFEKAIEIDPKYALSYLGLGGIYIFRFIGQTDPHYLDLGISYLQKALEFDPDLTEVYNRLTYAYTRKYKFRDAIETGKKAIELKVDNYETHYFVGVAYMIKAASDYEISAYEIAIDYLLEAIQLQTNFEPAHEVISWIYLLKGRYSDAKMHLQKAIEIEELNLHEGVQFIGAYTLMGNLNYRLRNFDEALTNYNKSLQSLETSDHFYSKPLLAITYIGLGNISFYKKEFDKALQFFNKAQSVIVEYAKSIGMGYYIVLTYICLAKVFNKLIMTKEAKLYFQKALDLFNSKKGYDFNWIWEGSDAQIFYEFAKYYAIANEKQEALTAIRKAIQYGYADFNSIQTEPDFNSLHNSPEFLELISQSEGVKLQGQS